MSAFDARKMVVAAAVIGVAAAGYWLTRPGGNETGGTGAPLVRVTVPELDGAAARGEAAFNGNCATCHGKNAAGNDGKGPPLVHVIYEPNHHSDGAFFHAAANGVRSHHWRFGNMPPVEGVSEDEVRDIVAYVRTLQRANGIH
ncbi:c-type cytochrome [Salaquimonas pukyongi]|uniref:c-type cytochrome n=1 Tax=Salaquimonas pukyongi TaxID=2712698 RepID=UPI00096BA789|nr:cytochrome c [Salaquimonas pukyongi]